MAPMHTMETSTFGREAFCDLDGEPRQRFDRRKLSIAALAAFAGAALIGSALLLLSLAPVPPHPSPSPSSSTPAPPAGHDYSVHVTVPYNFSRPRGSLPLPDSDPRVGQAFYDGVSPEQIRVLYYGPTEVSLTWVTGNASVYAGEVPAPDVSGESSEAQVRRVGGFGEALGVRSFSGKVDRYSYAYSRDIPGARNYTSGVLHRVRVPGLEPGTAYAYRVGSARRGVWSRWIEFAMPGPAPTYPVTFALVGDGGHTYNSSTTYDHMLQADPDLVIWVGDLCYADTSYSNGTLYRGLTIFNGTDPDFPNKDPLTKLGSYQPRWDMWGRLTEPLTSTRPFTYVVGNHEIERQSDGSRFVAFNARLPPNADASGSTFFYSFDAGPVHWVFLTSYTDYHADSDQVAWLVRDLQAVDRAVTPWLIVGQHAPMYNSYKAAYQEAECYRLAIEPILYEHNVDLVFSGHVHAYERSYPVYNYTLDPAAPVHVTVGDGGNIETVEVVYADMPGYCPPPEARKGNSYQPEYCLVQAYDGEFCAPSQPFWSAFREGSFGFATLEILNATTAHYKWHRNQNPLPVVADEAYFFRTDPNA